MQAQVWYRELKLEDAKSEASDALQIYEKLGLAKDVRDCRHILQKVEEATNMRSTHPPGELLTTILHPTPFDLHLIA
jgi:hypothetical protein